MSRRWKAGDVAIRRSGPQITRPYEQIAVAVDKCFNEAHDGTLHWHHASGGWDPLNAGEFGPTYRRVVVIDPEDREQVARLADAFCLARWSHLEGSNECDPLTRSSIEQALREFANPKPPCAAVLVIGSERIQCERDDDAHSSDHRNDSIGQGVRWSA